MGNTVCDNDTPGHVDAAEIQHSLRSIGLNISLSDARRILKKYVRGMHIIELFINRLWIAFWMVID